MVKDVLEFSPNPELGGFIKTQIERLPKANIILAETYPGLWQDAVPSCVTVLALGRTFETARIED